MKTISSFSSFPPEGKVYRITKSYASEGYTVRDVVGDGNCAIYAIAPVWETHLGHNVSVDVIRRLFVYILQQPEFKKDISYDLLFEDSDKITLDVLLARFRQPYKNVPPDLLAKATAWYTDTRIRVHVKTAQAQTYFDVGDERHELAHEILILADMNHVVMLFNRPSTPPLSSVHNTDDSPTTKKRKRLSI